VRNILGLLFLGFFLAAPSHAAARVALMDFSVEENSLRAQAAATNFAALVQAALTQDFELVERAQLAKAEQELKLSSSGRLSFGNSLWMGKWARADVLLRGSFFADNGERKFLAQAIDTGNADVLADHTFGLGISTNAPLSSAGAKIQEIAPELASLLRNASREPKKSPC
jgi:hypothetical protein